MQIPGHRVVAQRHFQSRLTLITSAPVMTTNVSGTDTIYLSPWKGNVISLPTPAGYWKHLEIGAEPSIVLSGLTADKNYDVFCYNNNGTPALELSAAWTNDTTRADAIAGQQGIHYKLSNSTRLLVGTFRATDTDETRFIIKTTLGVKPQMLLSNYFNKVPFDLVVRESAANWTYTTNTWRQANANAQNQAEFVQCINDMLVEAHVKVWATNGAFAWARVGIGLDSTTVDSADFAQNNYATSAGVSSLKNAAYHGFIATGFHYLAWLERSEAAGSTAWWGAGSTGSEQNQGMMVKIWG